MEHLPAGEELLRLDAALAKGGKAAADELRRFVDGTGGDDGEKADGET